MSTNSHTEEVQAALRTIAITNAMQKAFAKIEKDTKAYIIEREILNPTQRQGVVTIGDHEIGKVSYASPSKNTYSISDPQLVKEMCDAKGVEAPIVVKQTVVITDTDAFYAMCQAAGIDPASISGAIVDYEVDPGFTESGAVQELLESLGAEPDELPQGFSVRKGAAASVRVTQTDEQRNVIIDQVRGIRPLLNAFTERMIGAQ